MPFKSQAQRRFMYARHPELAAEFEAATPKGKKLPEKKHPEKTVKRAFDAGIAMALSRFKLAGEEIRLKIPHRQFHGWDAAWRNADRSKRADEFTQPLEPQSHEDDPIERLTAAIQELEDPKGSKKPDATKDPLDRNVQWGAPSNLSGGDTANRGSDMGQNTAVGQVW